MSDSQFISRILGSASLWAVLCLISAWRMAAGAIGIAVLSTVLIGDPWVEGAWAQIQPDRTLPQSSQVRRSGNRTAITGGTQRGRNLFHSLRRFSIQSGETASFQMMDDSVTRVFVRVTGREISRLNGTLEVLGVNQRVSGADFFLLNPNGIRLGRNAVLRLGGSLMATTADRVEFADGTRFSAVQPQLHGLLTVSVPRGLQFSDRSIRTGGQITVRTGLLRSDLARDPVQGGETWALIGGEVNFTNSLLETVGDRLEIGSVTAGRVELIPLDSGWQVDYGDLRRFGKIRLNNAFLITSGDRGGEIQLQGGQIGLDGFSTITSSAQSQPGSDLTVRATQSLEVANGSTLATLTDSNQPAGQVNIRTDRLVIRDGGRIGSSTGSQRGRGGDVRVVARSITLSGISQDRGDPLSLLFTQSLGQGNAGNMQIRTERLQVLPGGQISATTFGSGNAGNMQIQATEIDLVGLVLNNGRLLLVNDLPVSGGLFVGTDLDSVGNGGRLTIETDRLRIRDGAILQATTYGSGNAGQIEIRARDSIVVQGRSEQGRIPARIAATSGGIREFSNRRSRQATGRGGDLTIHTPALTVESGGVIAVNSLNPESQGAGTMRIQADRVWLDQQGSLNAQTESGNRAEINLQEVDFLFLRRNSKISTSAGLLQGGGDGGNIRIDTGFMLVAPAENSDIDADAGQGDGGSIDIAAQGIIGITDRNQRTPNSDVTATSGFGVAGEISLSTPAIDPTRGIVELPSTPVDAARLIAQGCRARSQMATADDLGEFLITGRGGLPATPADLRSNAPVFTDWVRLPAGSGTAPSDQSERPEGSSQLGSVMPESPEISEIPETSGISGISESPEISDTSETSGISGISESPEISDTSEMPTLPATSALPATHLPTFDRPIVEAQGWTQDDQGRIMLVAQAAHPVPNAPTVNLADCET
ncbi:MAG: filamentous hemagglutinin N-terminal domain-containing protein [Elainella sp. Prado103]|nr:filamentous hemagglutinin N-terminal domain-containing protein [Elainella sp. Prado103]